ncbi:MAG TPA: hypothetical protein VN698_14245 [Bacteroidia bacterium]|nr:hypothetical protein [Bacteroidia bacterium]
MFFIKSLCIFFISVLIGFFICIADKKTFYYYTYSGNQKTEITKTEYLLIKTSEKISEGRNATNLDKEEVYAYKNAVIYGFTSFFLFMALISVFELWKRKNNTA